MFKNQLIVLTLTLMCHLCSCSLNSINFCKLDDKECSQRNAPYVLQCGQSKYTRSKTECKEYFRVENKLKIDQINVAFMNHLRNSVDDTKLLEKFRRFKSKIKKASYTIQMADNRFVYQKSSQNFNNNHATS